MIVNMSDAEFENLWKASDLPVRYQQRIVHEIDMLMYNGDVNELLDDATYARRTLIVLRGLSFISPRETDDLIRYIEDTVRIRLHQLKGVHDDPDL